MDRKNPPKRNEWIEWIVVLVLMIPLAYVAYLMFTVLFMGVTP